MRRSCGKACRRKASPEASLHPVCSHRSPDIKLFQTQTGEHAAQRQDASRSLTPGIQLRAAAAEKVTTDRSRRIQPHAQCCPEGGKKGSTINVAVDPWTHQGPVGPTNPARALAARNIKAKNPTPRVIPKRLGSFRLYSPVVAKSTHDRDHRQ